MLKTQIDPLHTTEFQSTFTVKVSLVIGGETLQSIDVNIAI